MAAPASTLVLGGARSGKSTFAERLTRDSGLACVFVATATAGDEEMHARIARHRTERDKTWRTIEEPIAIADVLAREDATDRAILVDCLTLWLSNLIGAGRNIKAETRNLLAAIEQAKSTLVLVSNEVGLGIVPDTPLGRRFRDEQGRLNQAIAAVVPNVVMIAAGLPMWLKRAP